MENNRLDLLRYARQVATQAISLPGFRLQEEPGVYGLEHIGGLFADAILQAGLNYFSVVVPRVQRLRREYPHLTRTSLVSNEIERVGAFELLQCRNARKAIAFSGLVAALKQWGIETGHQLQRWATLSSNRDALLEIPGIGPKTSDYLALLAGVDVVPVDRHVRTLLKMSGVPTLSYRDDQMVFSYAADLLQVGRRRFDHSVWMHFSKKGQQLSLFN